MILGLIALSVSCISAKTQVTSTQNVEHGKVTISTSGSGTNRVHMTDYTFSGALCTGQAWVYDGMNRYDTESASRSAYEPSSKTSAIAVLRSDNALHKHYYQWTKMSMR